MMPIRTRLLLQHISTLSEAAQLQLLTQLAIDDTESVFQAITEVEYQAEVAAAEAEDDLLDATDQPV